MVFKLSRASRFCLKMAMSGCKKDCPKACMMPRKCLWWRTWSGLPDWPPPIRVLTAEDRKKCRQLWLRTLKSTENSGPLMSAAGFWKKKGRGFESRHPK